MNFSGFQKIFASAAHHVDKAVHHVDKAVANTVSEVTGPKALNEYDIGEQIGSGGPGLLWKLFRAKPKSKAQQELSAEVCVWFLDKKAIGEERNRRGTSKSAEEALFDIFRADAKLMGKLRHPGVVRVVDALEETKGAMAMVTEPLFSSVANGLGDFENIEKVPYELKNLELGQLEVKHGILQLAETLKFIHSNAKIVHRAISPETIFLTTSGVWKFGGFGFAVMTDQVPDAPPFHYPDFDVDSPVLPLQPLLDYSAPELIRKPVKTLTSSASSATAVDVYSLALLVYHLVSKQKLLNCYNNQKTYLNRVMNLHRDGLRGIPLELEQDLRRMLNQDAAMRPTVIDFSSSPWFRDDIRLRALRFLEHLLERDNLQKTEFFKSLNGLWSGFDPRVLRYKVLPPLLSELKNESILQFTLPLVLLIAEDQSPRDFELYTQPAVLPVLLSAMGDILLLLVRHLPTLVSKASVEAMESHVLPMLVRAYEDSDPRVQEETLRRTKDLALKLDFDLVRAAVLPRVHALALKTSIAAVRVHALICLGDLVNRLDKTAVMDVLQTCARCAAVDHSPPTLMCVLAVADTIYKQQGVEFAAEHLLPLLTPMLIIQQLSPPQFAKYMRLVLEVLHKIEEMRGVNLSEADSISLDFAGLGEGSSTLTLDNMDAPKKAQTSGKPTTSWDATDDWGPINNSLPAQAGGLSMDSFVTGSSISPNSTFPASQPSMSSSLGVQSASDWSSSAPRPPPAMANPSSLDPFASSTALVPMGSPTTSPVFSNSSSSFGGTFMGQSSISGSGLMNNLSTTGMNMKANVGQTLASTGPSPALGPSVSQQYSLGSPTLQATPAEGDPFADWPPRSSGGSMLAPPSAGGVGNLSLASHAISAGITGGGNPLRQQTSVQTQHVQSSAVQHGLGNGSSWGGNYNHSAVSGAQQQPILDDFFGAPPMASQATQSRMPYQASAGGVSQAGNSFMLAPPPSASSSLRPPSLGRGRGRAQPAPTPGSNPGAGTAQGQLLDLL